MYRLISCIILLASFIQCTKAQTRARVERCYICRQGCENAIGNLQTCHPTTPPSNLIHVERMCYTRFINLTKLEEHIKDPIESDITDEDLRKFKLPRAYRSCGWINIDDRSKLFNSEGLPICLEDPNEKFACTSCITGDGCNSARKMDAFTPTIIYLLQVVLLIII